MLSEILLILIEIGSSLIGATLMARAWLHAVKLHPFNPVSQAIYQATNWLVQPLRKVLPSGKWIDWASLAAALLFACLSVVLRWMLFYSAILPYPMIPAALLSGVLTVLAWGIQLVILLTFANAILSWVNPLASIMPVLRTLTEPMLLPIRRIMPNLNGLDLSPIALIVLAQILAFMIKSVIRNLIGI